MSRRAGGWVLAGAGLAAVVSGCAGRRAAPRWVLWLIGAGLVVLGLVLAFGGDRRAAAGGAYGDGLEGRGAMSGDLESKRAHLYRRW
jgi:hypothetical protein